MQMISSVLENPVWRWWWWLRKRCVFDNIFPSHSSHTHTQTQLRWLNLWLQEAAVAVNQALASISVQFWQIDRKAWCHHFRKRRRKKKEPPFYIPRWNSFQNGRHFIWWEIETESNNTSLCDRQNEASISYLSFFTTQTKRKAPEQEQGGKDNNNNKKKKKIALLKPL